jgi:hypothetical protein
MKRTWCTTLCRSTACCTTSAFSRSALPPQPRKSSPRYQLSLSLSLPHALCATPERVAARVRSYEWDKVFESGLERKRSVAVHTPLNGAESHTHAHARTHSLLGLAVAFCQLGNGTCTKDASIVGGGGVVVRWRWCVVIVPLSRHSALAGQTVSCLYIGTLASSPPPRSSLSLCVSICRSTVSLVAIAPALPDLSFEIS